MNRQDDLGDYIHTMYQHKLELSLIRDKLHGLLNRVDRALGDLQHDADEMAIKKESLINAENDSKRTDRAD